VDGIQMMIGRSLMALTSSETTADVAHRDKNSRMTIRNVDGDSSATIQNVPGNSWGSSRSSTPGNSDA
jgi:hypothetical protein